MDRLLEDLLGVMTLERLERDLFRGESRDIGSPQVFGGQVLGQALMAATATVDDRLVHSLHAYFLRRGDFNSPIVYEVDRARDGSHFSTRRVVAIQHGLQIFNMSASFQDSEQGLEHQFAMPAVPAADELPDVAHYFRERAGTLPDNVRAMLERKRPFEFRPARGFVLDRPSVAGSGDDASKRGAASKGGAASGGSGGSAPITRSIWFRAVDRLPDDEAMHRCLLAYASDFYLLDTALLQHGGIMALRNLVRASIDHAMWFHRSVRVDDWLLYATDSPSASGARGLSRGLVFAKDGRLIASTAQEGLLRVLEK